MDDRIASLAIEDLVHQLEKNVEFLPQMRDQVRPFRAELKKLSSLLSKLKEKELEELTTEAYEAEDAIDDFVLNSEHKRRSKLGRLLYCLGNMRKLGDGKAKLEIIKQKLKNICNKNNPYDDNAYGSLHCPSSCMTGDDVVGFSKEEEDLVKQLVSGNLVKQLQVFSIIGMEGLGKTTFATMIFNNKSIHDHFPCRAWVSVPQEYKEYKTEELFRCILDQVGTEESDYGNEEDLKEVVSGCLEGKRYLIVIDNLCRKEVWDELKPAFPVDSNGSRILLTTRLEEVASHAGPRRSISLPFLDDSQRWELLSKTALKGESCPPELETIGKQIAAKCDGLPLAIVLLGGILQRKGRSKEKWSRLADNVGKYLVSHGMRSSDVALSYHNLQEHLKICLLYFGTFPEDMEIPARKLIQLWIAEGFIEQRGNRKMEDLGEEYLEGLIGQSLVQVRTRRTDGRVKTCRVLNLVRELCICIAEAKNFFQVYTNNSNPNHREMTLVLRLSILGDSFMGTELDVIPNHSQLRSLQCYDALQDQIDSKRLWRSLYNGFNSLRVLNLGTIKVDKIPKGVKKLFHLKYLRVNAPNLTCIQPSICNLLKLQTLDMRESCVHTIPNGIWKMKSLRHLYLGLFPSFPSPPESDNINNKALSSIQTLSGVRPDRVLKRLMVRAMFPNVTRLRICSANKQATLEFLESIDHLCHLQSLKIVNACDLPDPHAFPLTLTKMTLLETHLQPNCMRTLAKLPNLRILKLLKGSIDSETKEWISCNEDLFPKLQFLKLVDLEIEEWRMGRAAMRSLHNLFIKSCVRLEKLPRHLWFITTLQEVDVFQPSTRLNESLQRVGSVAGRSIRIHDAELVHSLLSGYTHPCI